ncbi:MAG: anthranilate synthase component I [Anaerolineales bacterium]
MPSPLPPPLLRELPADLETPVSVYLKLAGAAPSFLLESVTGGERLARYSFIGVDLTHACVLRGDTLEEHTPQGVTRHPRGSADSPLEGLRTTLERHRPQELSGLPRFSGGLVGYLGYEAVRFFEPHSLPIQPHPALPDGIFLLADTLVAYDHAFGRLVLIANPRRENGNPQREAAARLDAIEARLRSPLNARPLALPQGEPLPMQANIPRRAFLQAVERAKEHIAAGDTFQIVLSQRLEAETGAEPFQIYRTLRHLNPSPYMFYFDFGTLATTEPFRLIGASPEMHVRLERGIAAVRPIAGTRPRGRTPEADLALQEDLLADPKERAEHVMLVDLARNDLGRVCAYGSVHLRERMVVERYSHVMHIVSHVEGRLRPEYDVFDLLAATFPAGTVSGAPKIRAMQCIHELEPEPRGPYAGVVGYVSFDGSMDTCIAIRTLQMLGRRLSVQAGAGIVADSDPQREYEETLNKARALSAAVQQAEGVPC